MTSQQSLAQHFGFMYQVAAANLDGITQEQSLAQPSPGGNCANWILGHIVDVQNAVMGLVSQAPVWENDQLRRASYDPITRPAEAIDWETMKSRFLASKERCLSAMASTSDAALAEKVPHPFGGESPRVEILNLLAFHQTYHVGQLGLSRRIAGLEGAIKAPGQAERAVAR